MVLFEFEYEGHHFKLTGSSITGKEQLVIDGQVIEEKRNFTSTSEYHITHGVLGELLIKYKVEMLNGNTHYQLISNDEVLYSGTSTGKEVVEQLFNNFNDKIGHTPDTSSTENQPAKKRSHMLGMFGIGLKLFKSAKAIKVLLAGAALGGWSILFSWQFAVVLIAVIMFHEYGHVWAMKKMGMQTKGFYLIPFVGGVAVGDKAKTHWQQVFIAMMGPTFGLVMSIVFYLIYLMTESHWIGLLASVSALVNIFNLLPVMPLDGGQVVKSIVFSGRSKWQYIGLLIMSAAVFALSMTLGLSLISFFIVLGVIDLLFSWQEFNNQTVEAMDRYSSVFSLVWYLITVAVFIGIILAIASSGLPGA